MDINFIQKEHTTQRKGFLEWLGVPVRSKDKLFLIAFIHKSFAADYKEIIPHNERLEFVGDAILWSVISKQLFLDFPEYEESTLTLYKISLVKEETLAIIAKNIWLGKHILISTGEQRNKWHEKASILSDWLEALIGYIYLSLGYEEAEKFIVKYVYSYIANIPQASIQSYKTLLQEYIQKEDKETPIYKDSLLSHETKWNKTIFASEVLRGGEVVGYGEWQNKKQAQEAAAENAYTTLIAWQINAKK